MRRILLVEDDSRIAAEVKALLRESGYAAAHAPTLAEARAAFAATPPAAVLLDVNLPDGLGFDFCRWVRERDAALPVIFLTARLDEDSAVRGLSLGATDYVRKPFSGKELLLRLRRALKEQPGAVVVGDLAVDGEEHRASWRGAALELTPRELEILSLLVRNQGRLVPLEKILEEIDTDGAMSESAIKTYVSRLKAKLTAAGVRGIAINAIPKAGYRLEKE